MMEQGFTTISDVLNGPILIGSQMTEDNPCENEELSMWIESNGEYSAAVNITSTDKIPAGVYKVIYKNDDYRFTPIKTNNDEVYRFSKDFTSSILDEVKTFWSREKTYKEHNLVHKRGILLTGAPGMGKTAIINLLSEDIIKQDGVVLVINTIKDFQCYTDVLKPIFRTIEPDRPLITIIEDIDQLVENVGDAMLLDLLDGKNSIEHHLVILTSNNTSCLSSALLRPSRVDTVIEITAPNQEIRKEYFEKKGVPEELVDTYVKESDGMSFAELKELFVGTIVMGKNLDDVVSQLKRPFETKNYLVTNTNKLGL